MRRYQTEILIPADRYVGLLLPERLPPGRAIVTVQLIEPEPIGWEPADIELAPAPDPDLDPHDMEWWEEFEGPGEASGPRSGMDGSEGRDVSNP